mmetsp:Transcript_32747/g.68850  ORF Transcript_32747/g.68850 Transcript_32747/m.68850 type:complete len:251 (-) Transcript_32747:140-892(-)
MNVCEEVFAAQDVTSKVCALDIQAIRTFQVSKDVQVGRSSRGKHSIRRVITMSATPSQPCEVKCIRKDCGIASSVDIQNITIIISIHHSRRVVSHAEEIDCIIASTTGHLNITLGIKDSNNIVRILRINKCFRSRGRRCYLQFVHSFAQINSDFLESFIIDRIVLVSPHQTGNSKGAKGTIHLGMRRWGIQNHERIDTKATIDNHSFMDIIQALLRGCSNKYAVISPTTVNRNVSSAFQGILDNHIVIAL